MILREEDVGCRERVTTDEERLLRVEQKSGWAVQISRLSGGESFVGKRKKFFLFNAFIDFEPMLMA